MNAPLLQVTSRGLYCEAGNFYLDPWQPVPRAVITHAHADHARPGSGGYLTVGAGEQLLRLRVGDDVHIDILRYGEPRHIDGVRLSLHPAGHVLGSAQVRLEHRGEVWVFTGDYKLAADATCAAFEPLRCHTMVTESTFGLPIYRWRPPEEVLSEIAAWWRANQAAGRTSLLFAYALGKAQRVIAGLDPTIGPIVTHGAVERVTRVYRESGIELPGTMYAGEFLDALPTSAQRQSARSTPELDNAPRGRRVRLVEALVVAPPLAMNSPWTRRFGRVATGFASGWMQIRGTRRRRAIDRGFVLSDHADWPGLLANIRESGAQRVLVTHGYAEVLARYLREQGLDAAALRTEFEGERDDAADLVDAAETVESPES